MPQDALAAADDGVKVRQLSLELLPLYVRQLCAVQQRREDLQQ